MNKRFITAFIVIAFFIAFVAGAYYVMVGSKDDGGAMKEDFSNERPIQEVQNPKEDSAAFPEFSSPTVCTYEIKDEDGELIQSKVYIDGRKYKSEFLSEGNKFISVSDGEVLYTWTEGADEGIKMDLSCLSEIQNQTEESFTQGGGIDFKQYENPREDIQSGKIEADCEEISSVDVSVPSDISFTDQCEIIKNQLESFKDLGDQVPGLENLDIPDLTQ